MRIARVGFLRTRSRLSVFVSPPPPGTAELGPPFAWEFCGRIGSAVTSQRAGPAAAMVAKDYPFYLTVKRANSSLEVPPASSPAKDAEVRTSTWTSSVVCFCLHRFLSRLPPSVTASPFPSLTQNVPLFLSISHPLSPASPSLTVSCLPSLPSLWIKYEPPSLPLSIFSRKQQTLFGPALTPFSLLPLEGLLDRQSSV